MTFRERLSRLGPPISRSAAGVRASSAEPARMQPPAEHVEYLEARAPAARSDVSHDRAPGDRATEWPSAQAVEPVDPAAARTESHARLRALIARAEAHGTVQFAAELADARAPLEAPNERRSSVAGEVLEVTDDTAARSARLSQLRQLIGEALERDRRKSQADPPRGDVAPAPKAEPWQSAETAYGRLHWIERWLEPDHCHGRVPVRGALARLPATLGALALDPELAGLDLSRMLFLDTETTGLSGGTGTVAFLVGLANFEEGVLRVTQLIVPSLAEEAPMLAELAVRLAAASCVLTYNGKSFDWPLLRTRYVLNRLPVPALPPHVDLLHSTRRIWKARLGGLRLTEIEREVLHHFRDDDVSGSEIPARYFAFLRDGARERLAPILEHNQHDLIALAALLALLGERYERAEHNHEPLDALSFGKLALRLQDAERAREFARVALSGSEGAGLEGRALHFCGEVERRFGEASAAAAHYERALALAPEPERADLRLLLAKLYEHALKDVVRAYDHARHTRPAEDAERHGRRLARLTRKLQRTEREAAAACSPRARGRAR